MKSKYQILLALTMFVIIWAMIGTSFYFSTSNPKKLKQQDYTGNTIREVHTYLVQIQYIDNTPNDTVFFMYSHEPSNADIRLKPVENDPHPIDIPHISNIEDESSESIIYYGVKSIKTLKPEDLKHYIK